MPDLGGLCEPASVRDYVREVEDERDALRDEVTRLTATVDRLQRMVHDTEARLASLLELGVP